MDKIIAEALKNPEILSKIEPDLKNISQSILREFLVDLIISEIDNIKTIQIIIGIIQNLNFGTSYYITNSNKLNTNPLLLAANLSKNQIIKLLVENGADIDTISSSNTTPIMFCYQQGNFEGFSYLYQKGALLKTTTQQIENFPPSQGKLSSFANSVLDSYQKQNPRLTAKNIKKGDISEIITKLDQIIQNTNNNKLFFAYFRLGANSYPITDIIKSNFFDGTNIIIPAKTDPKKYFDPNWFYLPGQWHELIIVTPKKLYGQLFLTELPFMEINITLE